jgi:dTDP-4-amino-4,6-dideoxygalactose transaminase
LWWPELPDGACPLFAPVFVDDKLRAVEYLAERGIEAVPVWLDAPPEVPRGQFPDADYLRRHLLEVPCHQDLGDREMDYVAEVMKQAIVLGL